MTEFRFDPIQGKIVNPDGTPSIAFTVYWQKFREGLVEALEGLQQATSDLGDLLADIILLNELIVDAEAAIEAAEDATAAITEGDSLSKSWMENFTPPVVSIDNAGLATIANHDRHYGNGDVVAVTGDTLARGEAAGVKVYIYYDDAARAGGSVTYQYSIDEADAAQIGDRHNVGGVEVPAAGTASGGYARPPGYGGIEP